MFTRVLQKDRNINKSIKTKREDSRRWTKLKAVLGKKGREID
jgi:hypothetical protein